MHIILTHEQADFDGLASMLGAQLLEEAAVPVLPRRLNRNVQAFLTLYGNELPFIDQRDLPPKVKIETVTLVDTQALARIKGMKKSPQVFIVDHHPPRPDLPPEWTVSSELTGAAVTLLVEEIQEKDILLTLAEATLLLIGIYEDTGHLTYSRTTPRDIYAAAYLLEQGANLEIASDFLNHPLSTEQLEIYDQLKKNTQDHRLHGNLILLSDADARHSDDDLSSIAHKLRDGLDPDALILLIQTKSGVQLIGRATTDQVNVGALASHFGGGGHARAAAALVTGRELIDIKAEVEEVLPQFVTPALTVREIMSSDPHMISPDTEMEEAAENMRRYGYEGYPVVEKGKLLGLLTRRAVDRAISHKLDLKAKDVMDAGSATISPQDSVEILQNLMTDTGWGQIPVVESDSGKIIGIVTRTDLIKSIKPQSALNGRHSLAKMLEGSLPFASLALIRAVADLALENQMAIYIVGGFVRDLLLDQPSIDFDLVVEGDAIKLGRSLSNKYGGRVVIHKRFGTAKWQIDKIRDKLSKKLSEEYGSGIEKKDFPEYIDLVSARREFYSHPTALPTVERGSIKLDLHRRDFTFNTLALRLDGRHYAELHDYWGGNADLKNGLVRVLHSLSFVDDPTRILRAVRFEQRFGYEIEARTLELINAALPLIDRLSGDRLRNEINTILQEPQAFAMLDRLNDLNVFEVIHEALPWDNSIKARLSEAAQNSPEAEWQLEEMTEKIPLSAALAYTLWFLSLSTVNVASICGRLRLPSWLTKISLAAAQMNSTLNALLDQPPSKVVEVLEDVPRLAIYANYLTAKDDKIRDVLTKFIFKWRKIHQHTSGHDLRTRNIPPGPEYRRILESLRAAWLDGEISTKDEEENFLEELLNE